VKENIKNVLPVIMY